MRKVQSWNSEVIDIDGLYARFDGATEVIPEIAKEFLNELPQYLKELNESVNVMDAKKLALAAHTLKGALSNFKADAAVELAFKIELAARRENLEGVDIKFEALKDLLACVKIQLESLLISESA